MKDSYLIFVLAAVLITPFLPLFLKGKCPGCGKRQLESLEDSGLPASAETGVAEAGTGKFIAFFICKACGTKFRRERSGPMEPVRESSPDAVPV